MKKKVAFKFDENSWQTLDEVMVREGLTKDDFIEVAVIRAGKQSVILVPKLETRQNRLKWTS